MTRLKRGVKHIETTAHTAKSNIKERQTLEERSENHQEAQQGNGIKERIEKGVRMVFLLFLQNDWPCIDLLALFIGSFANHIHGFNIVQYLLELTLIGS